MKNPFMGVTSSAAILIGLAGIVTAIVEHDTVLASLMGITLGAGLIGLWLASGA